MMQARIAVGVPINDGEGCCWEFTRYGTGIVRMATHLFSPRRHSGEGRNPGKRSRGVSEWQVLPDGALVVIPAMREWLV